MVNHPNRKKKKFHEGQEVEVLSQVSGDPYSEWHKARIVEELMNEAVHHYTAQFPDGTRAVFDARRVRAIK